MPRDWVLERFQSNITKQKSADGLSSFGQTIIPEIHQHDDKLCWRDTLADIKGQKYTNNEFIIQNEICHQIATMIKGKLRISTNGAKGKSRNGCDFFQNLRLPMSFILIFLANIKKQSKLDCMEAYHGRNHSFPT
jgi:hypothetical protein